MRFGDFVLASDQHAQASYLSLEDTPTGRTVQMEVLVDFDDDDRLIGVEFLGLVR